MILKDFDLFEESEIANGLFESCVPYGDEAFMVLKAHLILEKCLIEFIQTRVTTDFLKDAIQTRTSPCRSGLGLILLAEGLSLRDEVPQAHAHIVWPALKELNVIRNRLIHDLEPEFDKMQKMIIKFIEKVWANPKTPGVNINQLFRACVSYVHGLITIDKRPLTYDDLTQ